MLIWCIYLSKNCANPSSCVEDLLRMWIMSPEAALLRRAFLVHGAIQAFISAKTNKYLHWSKNQHGNRAMVSAKAFPVAEFRRCGIEHLGHVHGQALGEPTLEAENEWRYLHFHRPRPAPLLVSAWTSSHQSAERHRSSCKDSSFPLQGSPGQRNLSVMYPQQEFISDSNNFPHTMLTHSISTSDDISASSLSASCLGATANE